MSAGTLVLILLALIVLSPVAVAITMARRFRIDTLPDERHVALTDDGWHLALHRYRPRAEGPGRGAVILCHGLLANRANHDLDDRRSLARHLSRRGFDAWILELRGSGFSRDPRGRRGLSRVTFDHYVTRDIPAAIAMVCRETGAQEIQWVGHSMGGMLLYAYLSLHEDPRIGSATTIASPLDFNVVARRMRPALRMRPLLRLGPVPIGWILRATLPFLRFSEAEAVNIGVLRENLTPRDLSEILVNVIDGFGAAGVLAQFGEWVEKGTFASRDGSVSYGSLAYLHCPLLVIAAEKDLLTPPASVTPAIDRAPSAEKVYRLFGRGSGDDRDFGHGDIVLSDAARERVYPVIADWLVRHAPKPIPPVAPSAALR